MRRLVHTGNYLQSANLIHLHAMNKLKKNGAITYPNPLLGWDGSTYYRERLQKISIALTYREELFNKLQQMAQEADLAQNS